jgi:hypothetical protein
MLNKDSKWVLDEYVVNASDSQQLKDDMLKEILSELYNDRYDTDEQRVQGIIEAIEFVTCIKISK